MSKVEVNTIEPQCGTTLTVGKCTTSVAVPGNVVKSNALQASDGGNIVSQCGTTITLGATGDAITLASGATQSGFGREGSVDWDTASIKTGTFSAVSGNGYFVNTSGGTATVNLPAGAAGSIVAIADYTRTFNNNNCTVAPNGAEKVGGVAEDATLSVSGQSATFVYVDGTEGWINVQETQTSQTGLTPFINACGGTVTDCGDYRIHKFTGPGTFAVSALAPGPSGNPNNVDYLVVAGGGGGGVQCSGGGGGAGGFRESHCATTSGPYTASPIVAPNSPSTASLPLSVLSYPIVVGGGGTGSASPAPTCLSGGPGNTSTFSTIDSAGGGGGAGSPNVGIDGGSGGGAAHGGSGGSGNTPPTSPAQGTDGANSSPGTGPAPSDAGAGGGGATAQGQAAPAGHAGGAGATTEISAAPVAYAGGGGGTNRCAGCAADVAGGVGGGGRGGFGSSPGPLAESTGVAGGCNTGGGGGGGKIYQPPGGDLAGGAAGGSGIVIIRYKFQ